MKTPLLFYMFVYKGIRYGDRHRNSAATAFLAFALVEIPTLRDMSLHGSVIGLEIT